ncbi:IS3 family transposase [Aneurinibacillus migulanus]|uniref:Integrase core domain-containing protein n=2 Tax=Aneurinibacillus migulanus TaxID=47500 RepID=A0A1G8ZAB2_ANEMI|nr:DDE-type integrase/transposase/recombinase [Aneurinibacillus migulanus]MED0894185.1 IS3 family transposase [Aneurinibacillus migulanus]SDK12056.1 Integrase core domain-containing protein [Aneurinibacillus migulanus]
MKELGLKSRTVKKYKATTNSRHNLPVYNNVLAQKFSAQAPNQVWMADITYIPSKEGWLYLASIMDLYTRKIVGWHVDKRLTKELVYLETFSTRAEAKKHIFEYIACFYNGKRIHSSIGYVTPNQCERTYRKTA